MRVAYGDLIGGVSGDMFVAALLDAGLPLNRLRAELRKIPGLKFQIATARASVSGICVKRFNVTGPAHESCRSWKEIQSLINKSRLHPEIKETGFRVFSRLAAAEGKVHGVAPEEVHFHEIGATDSIVDIMATAIGIRELGIDGLHFSPVPLGSGVTGSRHGPLPVPAPATLELLRGLPVKGIEVEGETVTPTGAALISTLGKRFGDPPSMTIEAIGYGTGQKTFASRPNLFRLIVGSDDAPWEREEMLVIETNIDDMNPEFYDYVVDRLFAAGARDVFLSAIQMKKNRPGTLLRVIAEPSKREELAKILFRETSTIGIRYYGVKRMVLKRSEQTIKTRFGNVRVKVIDEPDGTKRASPEYDDVKRIAAAKNVPLKLVHDEAVRNFKN
jgi:uncharacterized protein (TIGR00299 family) protein